MHARFSAPSPTRQMLDDVAVPLMECVGRSACDLPFAQDFKLLPRTMSANGVVRPLPWHLGRGLSCGWALASVRFHSARPNGAGPRAASCAKETTINAFPQQVPAATCPTVERMNGR